MKWLLIGLAVFAVFLLVILLIGLSRPRKHLARCRAVIAKSPEDVWQVLSDLEKWGEWNPEVQRVERMPERNGHAMWLTVGSWGEMPTEIIVSEPPHRLQTLVDGGSFRGSWTFHIEPSDSKTQLTITEEGEVGNPFFRAMMMFHDNHATIRAFMRALGSRIGEPIEPIDVR